LRPEDRAAGFKHRLSIWQCEVSLTQVFDRPMQGRHRRTPPPPRGYRTRVITSGVNPSIHIEYKRSHVKQYFKEERALRTETTINAPEDFNVNKGLKYLEHLRDRKEQINRKLLEVERVSQNCTLSQDALDRLQQPTRLP
jgi:hypothetical protein